MFDSRTFAISDWLGLFFHATVALIYLILFAVSVIKDPYRSVEEPMPMHPLARSGARLCSSVAVIVGLSYSWLLIHLLPTAHKAPYPRFVSLDIVALVFTIVMLFVAAFALLRHWQHNIGLFILATLSSVVDALVLPQTLPEHLVLLPQLLTFLGSTLLVISVGWLYSVQYFYYQKTHQ